MDAVLREIMEDNLCLDAIVSRLNRMHSVDVTEGDVVGVVEGVCQMSAFTQFADSEDALTHFLDFLQNHLKTSIDSQLTTCLFLQLIYGYAPYADNHLSQLMHVIQHMTKQQSTWTTEYVFLFRLTVRLIRTHRNVPSVSLLLNSVARLCKDPQSETREMLIGIECLHSLFTSTTRINGILSGSEVESIWNTCTPSQQSNLVKICFLLLLKKNGRYQEISLEILSHFFVFQKVLEYPKLLLEILTETSAIYHKAKGLGLKYAAVGFMCLFILKYSNKELDVDDIVDFHILHARTFFTRDEIMIAYSQYAQQHNLILDTCVS